MTAGLARFKELKMQNCRMQKFYEFWKSNAVRPEYFLVAAALTKYKNPEPMARGFPIPIEWESLEPCESVIHAGQDTNRSRFAAEETARHTGGSGGGKDHPITRAEVVVIALQKH